VACQAGGAEAMSSVVGPGLLVCMCAVNLRGVLSVAQESPRLASFLQQCGTAARAVASIYAACSFSSPQHFLGTSHALHQVQILFLAALPPPLNPFSPSLPLLRSSHISPSPQEVLLGVT